jgi:ATP-dependent DNA helicase RecG
MRSWFSESVRRSDPLSAREKSLPDAAPSGRRPRAGRQEPRHPAQAAGTRTAQLLRRMGLERDWDLALHAPLRYRDESSVTSIAQLVPGQEAQVEAEVRACEVVYRGRRQLVATLKDDSGELIVRLLQFFPSQRAMLAVGQRVRALGTVRGGWMGVEMVHPQLRPAEPPAAGAPEKTAAPTLTPVYPATAGLPQHWLRRRIAQALQTMDLADTLPESIRIGQHLPELSEVLHYLHGPPVDADVQALQEHRHPIWERLKFDELLAQQLALRIARQRRQHRAAPTALADGRAGLTRDLLGSLPFRLTASQRRVWDEVQQDLSGAVPMNRLLQGDVGSGKTVIAALAAAFAIERGWQAALMAPTELLAEQHFGRIVQWLAPHGVAVAWLAGRQRADERRAALAALRDGAADLAIGTHALVQPDVQFARLGLAIVDEQHRFGVAQRLALRDPGSAPHLLMLSATPIPRTLAMTYLADLDVSSIDELPPGRLAVATKLVSRRRRQEVLQRIRLEVAAGRQAYWICPMIEEGQDSESSSATHVHEQLSQCLPQLRIGLVHGALPSRERSEVMQAFGRGDIDLLVATTVVEVGVDVPNANLMVIEHAQRFGLATLHQLRGRIGRGPQRGACVLLFDEPLAEPARERLRAVFDCDDGFEIARLDLKLRGPGEVLGARQWGLPMLRFADLERDGELLERARGVAADLLRQHPGVARAHVQRWLPRAADFLDA